MMKTVSAREANQHFSKLLYEAKVGEEIIVTSRGRPVAKITGIANAPNDRLEAKKKAFVKRLRSRPVKSIPEWTRDELYEKDS